MSLRTSVLALSLITACQEPNSDSGKPTFEENPILTISTAHDSVVFDAASPKDKAYLDIANRSSNLSTSSLLPGSFETELICLQVTARNAALNLDSIELEIDMNDAPFCLEDMHLYSSDQNDVQPLEGVTHCGNSAGNKALNLPIAENMQSLEEDTLRTFCLRSSISSDPSEASYTEFSSLNLKFSSITAQTDDDFDAPTYMDYGGLHSYGKAAWIIGANLGLLLPLEEEDQPGPILVQEQPISNERHEDLGHPIAHFSFEIPTSLPENSFQFRSITLLIENGDPSKEHFSARQENEEEANLICDGAGDQIIGQKKGGLFTCKMDVTTLESKSIVFYSRASNLGTVSINFPGQIIGRINAAEDWPLPNELLNVYEAPTVIYPAIQASCDEEPCTQFSWEGTVW